MLDDDGREEDTVLAVLEEICRTLDSINHNLVLISETTRKQLEVSTRALRDIEMQRASGGYN